MVLAGGAGRRLGGAAKPTLAVGGTPMLARVLAAVDDADGRVVVGPGSLGLIVPPGVRVIQEEPAGGGPVAALAAGLAELAAGTAGTGTAGTGMTGPGTAGPGTAGPGTAGPGTAGPGTAEPDVVVVLAADLPLLTQEAVEALLLALGDHDGAVFVDDGGRRQWLCGVWRSAALSERLAALAASGPLGGRAMRELVAPLRVVGVPVGGGRRPPWYDCDTPADLADAERRLT
ncbi:molybdenum cofactor guanylyltransferase [Virgisporangium aurantiacum]|uniref:molybdenum cofactor guanylyltransferase n=1 Tax=Virgisporangium aurantiacum TaxID=175570 RepID=UPI0040330227